MQAACVMLIETFRNDVCDMQGLDAAVRKEGWRYLLGYWPWSSTEEQRRAIKAEKAYVRARLLGSGAVRQQFLCGN
jgi:phosphopantothenate synthetase